MCGIVGIAGPQEAEWLTRMSRLVIHRGPDDSGEFRDPEASVSLAMRRLSILDLAGGRQPMANEEETIWIVHNGEIYNSPELRRDLEARGHRLRSINSDTEVLLHLYEDKREEMLADLNGMFAFVIYDRSRKLLFGARDRIGIKPLYYLNTDGVLAFASELKALLPLPIMQRELDPSAIFHYMSLRYIPGEGTIFRGARRLPAGHCFTYDLSSRTIRIRQYWDLDVHRAEQRPVEEWRDLIRTHLRECVRRWTLSDVPIACSLSGGLDSSAIVGLLAEMGYPKVKTYSLGFTGPGEAEWNELPLARQVAARWGTDHHELTLQPEEVLRDLVRMVWHLDEPYAGGLPSWYVFQFMGHDVKVALTGTGGDELFGNYGKFRAFERSPLMRASRALAGLVSWQDLSRFPGWRDGPCRRHYPLYFRDREKRRLVFSDGADGIPDTADILQGLYRQAATSDPRNGIAYVDFKTQLPEEFLLLTDRFSMAHSVEARVPFLDHTMVELAFRIPSSVRTRADDLKYLLRNSTADLIPPDLLTAPKRGFEMPIRLWLRTQLRPLAERLLAPERLRRQGIFRSEFYHRYVSPHLEGRADHTWKVWTAVLFQLWHLIFIEECVTEAPAFSWQDIC